MIDSKSASDGVRRANEPPPISHGSGSFEIPLFSKRAISDGPRDLTAAEAAGARINVLRGTVDDGLDALHIGLPSAVGAAVGMADLDAESDILLAVFTLCHTCCTSSSRNVLPFRGAGDRSPADSLLIIADRAAECKMKFHFLLKNFSLLGCCQIGRN